MTDAEGAEGSGRQASATGADPADLTGTILAGRYRILRKLGEGAMGAVYLGEHVKIGRQDAIKVLRETLATDREAMARFTRGARNVSAIHHPNVCTIYDFSDTADGLQFLAMELVSGETLKDLLEREGALPVERAVSIAAQTAEALQAAHEAGIVHRDLKPANIMIVRAADGSERVKVVDFDIAKGPRDGAGEEVTRLGFVIGTPEYMSPEQLMGEALDGRSDTYSLALVLFRSLTGTLPFPAETTQDVMIRRLTDAPLRLDQAAPGRAFPRGLQEALDAALQRRREDRPANAAAFGQSILRAAAGAPAAPVAARGTADLPATRIMGSASTAAGASTVRPRSRRMLVAAAALAGVVVLAVALTQVMSDGGATGATGEPARNTAAQGQTAAPGDAGAAPVVTPPPDAEAGRQQADGARQAEGTSPADAGTTGRTAARDGVGRSDVNPARPDPAGPGAPAFAVADANAALLRQLDLLGAGTPPRRTLDAIRDTAQLVWDLADAPDRERAFAAFVMGNALWGMGESAQAVEWLERAVALRPDGPGYQELLDAYRRPRT